jgi:hypothetical protein
MGRRLRLSSEENMLSPAEIAASLFGMLGLYDWRPALLAAAGSECGDMHARRQPSTRRSRRDRKRCRDSFDTRRQQQAGRGAVHAGNVRYSGRRLVVDKSAVRVCDTIYPLASRGLPETVLLGNLRSMVRDLTAARLTADSTSARPGPSGSSRVGGRHEPRSGQGHPTEPPARRHRSSKIQGKDCRDARSGREELWDVL